MHCNDGPGKYRAPFPWGVEVGVTGLEGADAGPVPTAFAALTVNV